MSQKNIAITALVATLLILTGVFYYNTRPEHEIMTGKAEDMMKEGQEMMEKGKDMVNEGEEMMKDAESMSGGSDVPEEENGDSFRGEILAGNSAKLLDFNRADYEKVIKSDKLIVLYFYANWCPTCKIEFPKMQQAFDELETEGVVGFRVNFNDNQTDSYEKELAREFGVPYQHTKVFIKNGDRILKSPESWEKDRYLSEIQSRI